MCPVVSFGDEIIYLLRSEGGEDRREGGDEAGCIERVFLEAGIKEDGASEQLRSLRIGGIFQGDYEDPFRGGDREDG